jgi:hypothetical protein
MNRYFSVKEIADWCDVSKTTIQRTINELELTPKRDKNRHLYTEDDVQLICRKLNRKPIETESKTADDSEQNKTTQTAKNQHKTETKSEQNENHGTKRNETDLTKDEFIKFLQKEIEIKNQQIESQSEEIKMLILTNGNLTKQIELLNQPNQLVEAVDVCVAEEVGVSSDEAETIESSKPKWWKFWA